MALNSLLRFLMQGTSEDLIKDIAGQTSGFLPRDMRSLIADAGMNLIPRDHINFDKADPGISGESSSLGSKEVQEPKILEKEDLFKALERSKKRNASALGTPKVNSICRKTSSNIL